MLWLEKKEKALTLRHSDPDQFHLGLRVITVYRPLGARSLLITNFRNKYVTLDTVRLDDRAFDLDARLSTTPYFIVNRHRRDCRHCVSGATSILLSPLIRPPCHIS